ncbi:MAG: hypothetical protein ACI8YQ_002405 [Polaribacter sp.]|jgi:hypothetical protein
MIFSFLITAFLFLSGNPAAHEIHISKCQVEYSEEDKAIQVTMHIYLDDLEEILRKKGADKLFICTELETEGAEEYLIAYLRKQFQMEVNDKVVEFNFIGKEPSGDLLAAWCYLEFPNITELKNLTIENEVLMDLYDDQKNIVSIMAPGNQQGYFLFEKGSAIETMSF